MVSELLRKLHNDHLSGRLYPQVDCSEIAEQFLKLNGQGRIITITEANNEYFRVPEVFRTGEGIKENLATYNYHSVYVLDGVVYDPRISQDPISYNNYMENIQANNKGSELKGGKQ